MGYQEQGRFEHPVDAAERKIHALYQPDVDQVVTALATSPLVITTGPYANGKTRHLIPTIARKLREQGHDVLTWEAQNLIGKNKNEIWFPPNPTHGVIIIDEAGGFVGANQENEISALAHERGYSKLIPIITYDIDTPAVRDHLATRWAATENPSGQSPTVIHFPPKLLPDDLAREFVVAQGIILHTPPEAIEYILSTLPYNLRVLDMVSGEATLERTKAAIRRSLDMWHGVIPAKQLETIAQKVGPGFFK